MLRRRNFFQERYQKFYNELRHEIVSGDIQPGEFILPENALGEKYELSRVSIRKALAELVEEGLIEKIAGLGNRVRMPEAEITRETLKLAWYSTSYELGMIRELIARYEAIHPHIHVELVVISGGQYYTEVVRGIQEGTGPDVFVLADSQFGEMIERNQLSMLHPPALSAVKKETDSYPKIFEMFSYHNELKAVPFIFSPIAICYNEAIFAESGIDVRDAVENWEQLLDIAQRCTKDLTGNGLIDQYGFCFSAFLNRWPVFLYQNEALIRDKVTQLSHFSSERTVEALKFCIDLMYRYQVSPIYSLASNTLADSLFKKGRTAMILTTYYYMNEFRDHPIKWNILPVKGKAASTLLMGSALAVNSASDKIMLAQNLIEFLTGDDAQRMVKMGGCTIPMLRVVAEDDDCVNPEIHPQNYNVFTDMLDSAITFAEMGLNPYESRILTKELLLLWSNMESPEEACTRIEQLLNARHESVLPG